MRTVELLSQLRRLDVKLWVDGELLRFSAPSGVLTRELREELVELKKEIVEYLRGSEIDSGPTLPPLVPIAKDGPFPLSFAQQRLWFMEKLMPGSSVYVLHNNLRFVNQLNLAALEQALVEITRRHTILRATFSELKGEPFQAIQPMKRFNLSVVDLSELGEAEREFRARLLATEHVRAPFHLAGDPLLRAMLLRLAAKDHAILMTMHHIVSDGWSVSILAREMFALYDVFSAGTPSPLPELKIQYVDFAMWQREWLRDEVLEEEIAYWKNRLSDAPVLELPTDRPRPLVQSDRGDSMRLHLSVDLGARLKELNQQEGATLFMALLAAFQTLLYRYAGQPDVVVGTPIAGRQRVEVEPLIGFFVNTLVMRTEMTGEPSFRELMKRVRHVCLGAYAHQHVPFEKLVEDLQPERNLSRSPLFQVMFVLQNTPLGKVELEGLRLSPLRIDSKTSAFDLSLSMVETNQGLFGSFEYNTDLFEPSTIERMIGHFQMLLSSIVADPDLPISELTLLSEGERRQLLREANSVTLAPLKAESVNELFEAQVERMPEAVALVCTDKQLTYAELNRRANRLAHYLRSFGVEPEVPVGICVERSPEMVIAVLSVMKAGGVYVPLDPAYPEERLAYMLDDVRASVLLTQKHLADRFPDRHLICLDADWEPIERQNETNPVRVTVAGNLAYLIYTSGSTGRAKGVMVSHGSLVNVYAAWHDAYKLGSVATRHLQMAGFAFDVCAGDLVRALCSGGTLVLCPRELLLAPRDLYGLICEERVDCAEFVPAVLRNLMQYLEENERTLDFMRVVIAGSDIWYGGEYEKWMLRCGAQTRLINSFGLTEATIDSTYYEGRGADLPADRGVPVGRPFANTNIYVLDLNSQPTPIGIAGELYLGGAGLARGYLNQPELTAGRFIPHHFSDTPGARLYKTGDRVRFVHGCNLEFIGRLDQQVKVRGYRIELGEIDAALRQHPAVSESVVIADESRADNKQLVAYVVPNKEYLNLEGKSSIPHLDSEQESQWQVVFDDLYREFDPQQQHGFYIKGWTSSYTNELIPEREVAEWVDQTVERIQSLGGDRIYEIGSGGSGLMMLRIAPRCKQYWATDLSARSIALLRQQVAGLGMDLPQVKFSHRSAGDFEGIVDESLDLVIIVSVVQYFPSIDYLMRVLEKSTAAVADGGHIFLGDIRSLPLLEAFHTSVQLHKAASAMIKPELQQRVQNAVLSEKQLVIDPEFFSALKSHLPRISHVEILLERGVNHNELSKYRYDVILHIGREKTPRKEVRSVNWRQENLTIDLVEEMLERDRPGLLQLEEVPNARVLTDVRMAEMLASEGLRQTVGDLRKLQEAVGSEGIDPESLWLIGGAAGYDVRIGWRASHRDGRYDVVFHRFVKGIRCKCGIFPEPAKQTLVRPPWHKYSNVPLHAMNVGKLPSVLRAHLTQSLPDYMVPSTFVTMESLPLTANGKLNRKLLPAVTVAPPVDEWEAVRTPTEELIASIWADVLRLERVGIHQNFFEIGGHSLLATQVISRMMEAFGVEVLLRTLFESPTIAGLANQIEAVKQTRRQVQPPAIEKVSRDRVAVLSFSQERLWFLDQLMPGSTAYNIPTALSLEGQVNLSALEQALNEVTRRHEILRTIFQARAGQPAQLVGQVQLAVRQVDLGDFAESTAQAKARALAQEEAGKAFDLAKDQLVRVTVLRLKSESHLVLFTMHHIITDGWSMEILLQEVVKLYAEYTVGKSSSLAELPIQYVDFAVWQRDWLRGEFLATELAYWKRQLSDCSTHLELPVDRPRLSVPTQNGASGFIGISESTTGKLKELCRSSNTTLFMTLLSAFYALLHRYTGQDDISIGTPIAGRPRLETESLIGFFVNTLVLRANLSGDLTFRGLLHQVREITLEAHEHQSVPFERLVEELQPPREINRSPLFQVMFVFQNAPPANEKIKDLRLVRQEIRTRTAKFDLSLTLVESGAMIRGSWEYNTDLFNSSTITRMISHFQALLAGAGSRPDDELRSLSLLTENEREQLLVEWNDTRIDRSPDLYLHRMIGLQAEETAESVALVFEEQHLTYRELDQRSCRLARYLCGLGIGPETVVGLCMNRCPEMMVALLGIMKAGGAYLPLDPDHPLERLTFMLEDARATAVITHEEVHDSLPKEPVRTIDIDRCWNDLDQSEMREPKGPVSPDNIAYLIYTSGSTGRPKGVVVTHRGLSNYLMWAKSAYAVSEGSGWPIQSSLGFDLTITSLFTPLISGGKAVLMAAGAGPEILEKMADGRERYGMIKMTPSHLQLLKHFVGESGKAGISEGLVIGGEALRYEDLKLWREQFRDLRLINEYGPTETVVGCCVYEVGGEAIESGAVPIGRPIDNSQAYVLGESLEEVPIGITGELCIGGEGLARGYRNQAAMSAEKFVPNPINNLPGARIYRTGDLVRWLADGNLEFLGRKDQQVKIRGFRIEPGEIEAILLQAPGVREAIVMAREDEPGNKRLVAYLVGDRLAGAGDEELKRRLKSRLPDYLLPSLFVWVEEMPLTANGKLDYRALSRYEPADEALSKRGEGARERKIAEEVLAGIWEEVLNREVVGIDQNFFEIGGHSLLATQVVSRVREAFEVEVTLRNLFEYQTIAALAELIEKVRAEKLGITIPPLMPAPLAERLPLSYAQQRLWFLDQLEPGTSTYNLDRAIFIVGPLRIIALEQSVSEIMRRHEMLRTRFESIDGQPYQAISDVVTFNLPLIDTSQMTEPLRTAFVKQQTRQEARRPFDLSRGPLVRLCLIRLGEREHVLIVTMHHIISDAWSIGILVNELAALFESFSVGSPSGLPELDLQYGDFASWQRQWLEGETLKNHLNYWSRQLTGLEALRMPVDRPRTAAQSSLGASRSFQLSSECSNSLVELSRRAHVTQFMVLTTAFQILLHYLTDQKDIAVGTTTANRNQSELERIIGFFVNMLVLRTDLSGNPTFRELLARVREVILEAFSHENLPFQVLVETLQPERDLSRTPFFQVVLTLHNAPAPALKLPNLALYAWDSDVEASRYDMVLNLWNTEDGLRGSLEYNTELYNISTIDRILGHFERVLQIVVAQPDDSLDSIVNQLIEADREYKTAKEQELQEANIKRLRGLKQRVLGRASTSER